MSATGDGEDFKAGELALLIDSKERRYMIRLIDGGEFHLHTGVVEHDSLIGEVPGSVVTSSRGSRLLALRPTLSDYILKMPRGAQVIYPKDLGPILMAGDLAPGQKVLEAGLGSGALSLAVLRMIGSQGLLVSYEIREDHAARAIRNIADFLGGEPPNHQVRIGDVCDGVESEVFDRVLLDLPEPWRAMESIAPRLASGGILVSYLPTIPQVATAVDAFRDAGLGMIETFEVLNRGWHVEGASVRPNHRMVGHTGFLIVGRKLAT